MITVTKTTSFRNRLKDLDCPLPEARLAPLQEFADGKLRRFAEPLAQLVASAIGDSPNFRSQRLDEFLGAVIAGLKARVNAQINEITGHPAFRRLDAANEAVEEIVFDREGAAVKKRVLNVSLADMRTALADVNGVPEHADFYGPFVRNEYHRPGGKPNSFAVLTESVGPEDAPLLTALLTIVREGNATLLADIKPGVVCPQDPASDDPPANFSSLPKQPDDIKAEYGKAENAPLHGVQQSPNATHFALGAGRVIGRAPYHPIRNPAPRAEFLVDGHGPLMIGPQVLLAKSLCRSFSRFGTWVRLGGVHSGGKHTRPTNVVNGEVMTTEIVVDDFTETAFAKCGLFSYPAWKYRDFVVSFGTPSAYVPVPSGDEKKDADAVVAAQFQFAMLSCQFGQLLKARLREALGQTVDVKTIKGLLEGEFKRYVTPDVNAVDQAALARKPLAKVSVDVTMPSPGVFHAQAQIQPHLLMRGARVTVTPKAEVSPMKP